MQVILALADARGAVLSREDLLQICWGGRIVGDDAINRAIAEARRIAATAGAGFEIETIPRVGYRLNAPDASSAIESASAAAAPAERWRLSRRQAVIGGAGAALAAGLGAWTFGARRREREVDALLAQGRAIEARGTGQPHAGAAALYRRAIRLDPQRAEGWGLLAGAQTALAEEAAAPDAAGAVREATQTAERALALDPKEPNARTALAVLRRGLDDWLTFERELQTIAMEYPDCFACLGYLTTFLQGVGRCRESWDFNERALRVEPLSPACHFRKSLKYWIFDRPADADRVSRRALELWPAHRLTWNARLTILAFTGRAEAGLAMVNDARYRPDIGAPALALWRAGLRALASRDSRDAAAAREIILASATRAPGLGANSVMLLSALGHVDDAYRVAEGVLMRRGTLFDQPQPLDERSSLYAGAGWRGTQWLFTPASAPLRADERFAAFCDAIGYTDYFRRRGVWPDRFVRGSLRTA